LKIGCVLLSRDVGGAAVAEALPSTSAFTTRFHTNVGKQINKKMKINMNSTRNLIANHKNKNNEDIIKQTKHLVMLVMLSEFCFFQCLNTY
jgi:hypothetical protein